MKHYSLLPSLAVSLALSVNANAAIEVFDSSAAFTAAAPSLVLQDFNSDFTTNATNPDPLSFDGFTVEETVGIANMHKFASGSEFLHFQSDNPSTVVFTFDTAITAFAVTTIDFARESGLTSGQTETVTYADNSASAPQAVVISRTSGGSIGVSNFFGVVNTEAFTEVSLTFSTGVTTQSPFNGDDVGLENLQFAPVPLPPALWLLASACGGLALRRRQSGLA